MSTAVRSSSTLTSPPPSTLHKSSLFGESLIRLSEVSRLLPPRSNGRLVGTSTVHRWVLKGVRGVRLETVNAPWGRVTSVEAVRRFLDRLNYDGKPCDTALSPLKKSPVACQADRYLSRVLRLESKATGEI